MTMRRRATLPWVLVLGAGVAALLAGTALGSTGWVNPWRMNDAEAQLLTSIRWPRSFGAWVVGALLGLAGSLAQGVFRNPLADPFLLGSASGAATGVAVALALGVSAHEGLAWFGLAGAAFVGAWAAVAMTVLLAGGVSRPMTVLVAGIAVGVVLGALREALTFWVPETLRAMQGFLLGSTSLITQSTAWWMAGTWVLCAGVAWSLARTLDAAVLGEDTAVSLGVPLVAHRMGLIAVMALATGVAVSQAGLIAFVGLAAPHVARRAGQVQHAGQMLFSAAAGGALLAWADVVARGAMPPIEWPVGLVTALVGGAYLMLVLRRRGREGALAS